MGKRKLIGVDLCCGAGGLSLGFEQAGIQVAAAIDLDPLNVEVHTNNFPFCHTILGSLDEFTAKQFREQASLKGESIDVVFGGPPCQGFSLMGKRDLNDPRSVVLLDFARLAVSLEPDFIVAENVAGLLQGAARCFLDAYFRILTEAGYHCDEPWLLNAADFGVPQSRRRVFLVAAKKKAWLPVKPVAPEGYKTPTVWDAISDLEVIGRARIGSTALLRAELGNPSEYALQLRTAGDEPLANCGKARHSKVVARRFRDTPAGAQEPISRFYRLSKNGTCNTLRAGTGSDRGSYMAARPIHPTQSRCLTVREAARLHGYPDSFLFHKTRWHGFRQVGNSVPPPFARVVATTIIKASQSQC
jgi:DNA (cytosine-5)-methyltransferase 1